MESKAIFNDIAFDCLNRSVYNIVDILLKTS